MSCTCDGFEILVPDTEHAQGVIEGQPFKTDARCFVVMMRYYGYALAEHPVSDAEFISVVLDDLRNVVKDPGTRSKANKSRQSTM